MSLLALATLISSLACSSSSSGGSAASPASIPEGLFLRPDGETDVKVYSNGQGLLSAGVDGSTNGVVIGTFDHDTLRPYNVADEDDGAGDGDDISVGYSYRLAESSSDFAINDNQLSFTGANSEPPYTLSIETALNLSITLPSDFDGRVDVDASGDTMDDDTREFALSGGGFSDTKEVASVVGVAATGHI